MAKKSKKTRRARNVLGSVVMLAPALLAAVTAFMNTAVARERGLVGNSNGDKGGGDKTDWFGDSKKADKRAKKNKG
jgi:hypothetical protein